LNFPSHFKRSDGRPYEPVSLSENFRSGAKILAVANEALLDVAEVVGAPEVERTRIRAWIERGLGGLDERWDSELGLCLDYDLRAGEPLVARTIAGFAPIIAGTGDIDRLEKGLRVLESHAFTGNPDLRRPLPPSASPDDLGFLPRNYWRGPVWPVMTVRQRSASAEEMLGGVSMMSFTCSLSLMPAGRGCRRGCVLTFPLILAANRDNSGWRHAVRAGSSAIVCLQGVGTL
jgi:hypothetical protein